MTKKILAAVIICFCTMIAFTACSANSDPIEDFAEAKSTVGIVDSTYLTQVKELCKMSLDDEKDFFIKAYNMDGINYINVHVLTEENEYIIYSVDSQMSGPLGETLSVGEAPAGFEYELENYLQEVQPHVDKENRVIYFDK